MPTMTSEQIRELAQSLQEEYFPGDLHPDPFELVEYLDIHLSVRDLGTLKGFYYILQEEPQIILSDRLSEETSRIVCAHELGHHLLHQRFAHNLLFGEYDLYLSHIRWEMEANQFAAHFLIPDALLASVLDTIPAPDIGVSMDELAHQCGTTQQLIAIKLGQADRPVVFPDGSIEMKEM